MFAWLISRIFSANEQYFSLTTNHPTILSTMTYQLNEQDLYESKPPMQLSAPQADRIEQECTTETSKFAMSKPKSPYIAVSGSGLGQVARITAEGTERRDDLKAKRKATP